MDWFWQFYLFYFSFNSSGLVSNEWVYKQVVQGLASRAVADDLAHRFSAYKLCNGSSLQRKIKDVADKVKKMKRNKDKGLRQFIYMTLKMNLIHGIFRFY